MRIIVNIVAVIIGVIIGGTVNMCLINVSPYIIPPPIDVDVTSATGLQEALPFFQPKHFIMPFLAHALGTFVGALLTAFIARSHQLLLAMIVGVVFLIGGIGAVMMLPAPWWYNAVDLIVCYIPMAWLAYKIAKR